MSDSNDTYDVRRLPEGTMLVAQTKVNGWKRTYVKGTHLRYDRLLARFNEGYAKIMVTHEDDTFETYDDYFRENQDLSMPLVLAGKGCMFDE